VRKGEGGEEGREGGEMKAEIICISKEQT
jgi:hypothetical protein